MTWNLSKALWSHRPTKVAPKLPSRRRKSRPTLEFLEQRALLATFTWSSTPADGNWENSANWVGGNVPTAASGPVDLVFPTTAANPTLTLQNGESDLQIKSLTIQGGNYTFQGPTAGGKLPLDLLDNSTITFSPGASLKINPSATPDSLALKFLGATTMNGTGFLYLNTSTVSYPNNPSALLPLTVNQGNLNLGASADLSKTLVTLATGTNMVVIDGASPTVGSVNGMGTIQIGTNNQPTGTGLTVATPAGRNDLVSGFVSGTGGTLTKTGAGHFTASRINPGGTGAFTVDVRAGNLGVQGLSYAQQTTLAAGTTFTATMNSSSSAARITAPANGGNVNLGGANLALALNGYTPAVGDSFTLISSPNGITGKFGNAAEGGLVYPAGGALPFQVHYTSTAVTITAVTPPALIATKTTILPLNPVAPGGTATYTASIVDANNNPVPGKGYFSFWYTDDFQSWHQVNNQWVAVSANGQATIQKTMPTTINVEAVVGFYHDVNPTQYQDSWSQNNGSIGFQLIQWYNTNTNLAFNSSNNTLVATISSPQGSPSWLGKLFSGAVLFKENGVTIGSAQVVNGVATFNWHSVRKGTTFTAQYIPDAAWSVIGSTGSTTA